MSCKVSVIGFTPDPAAEQACITVYLKSPAKISFPNVIKHPLSVQTSVQSDASCGSSLRWHTTVNNLKSVLVAFLTGVQLLNQKT